MKFFDLKNGESYEVNVHRNLTPRAQIMAMLAAGDVGRIWAASAEDMLVIMGRFRYLADEILRVDAEK